MVLRFHDQFSFRAASATYAKGIPALVLLKEEDTIRYPNGFAILAVVVAFAIGAGIGSGLGYRMGSSRIAVYTQHQDSRQRDSMQRLYEVVEDASISAPNEFRVRLEALESRLDSLVLRVSDVQTRTTNEVIDSEKAGVTNAEQTQDKRILQLQSQLENAGFTDIEYDVISATRKRLQLESLQMRDKAIREGWFITDSWLRKAQELDPDTKLREVLGDQRFDEYLIATGRNNRVMIDELMTGSAAQQAGLLAGDLIHRYAETRVFSTTELRNLTTGGVAGENTAVTVLRNGELIDLVVPRGPLGVMISAATLPADHNN